VDIEAATRSKIKVARIPGSKTGNSLACAELSIYLILALLKKQVCLSLYYSIIFFWLSKFDFFQRKRKSQAQLKSGYHIVWIKSIFPSIFFQKEMDIAVKQRKLGEPTGDTLFGKTVQLNSSFYLFFILLSVEDIIFLKIVYDEF
jgi:hypothetical protein